MYKLISVVIILGLFLLSRSCNEGDNRFANDTSNRRATSATISHMPGELNRSTEQTAKPEADVVSTVVDGQLFVDGYPFFPLGIYHISWAGSDAERLQSLEAIAAAGFNVIHPAIDADDHQFLQQANQLGVRVIVEFNQDPPLVIESHRDKDAIIGWNIADDVDDGRLTPAEVSATNTTVKADDPTRVTYISGFHEDKLTNFQKTADLIAIQAYPVGNGNLELDYVADTVDTVTNTINDRPVIANLQTFAWDSERPPTGDEVRNMTYQALIVGVDGIIYYTYFDENWDFEDHPELWNSMKRLVGEVNSLIPVFLSQTRQELPTGTSEVLAGIWTYEAKMYLIVVNTSADQSHQINVLLPSVITGEAQLLFESEPINLQIDGLTLTGTIQPARAHVFELSTILPTSTPIPPTSTTIPPTSTTIPPTLTPNLMMTAQPCSETFKTFLPLLLALLRVGF